MFVLAIGLGGLGVGASARAETTAAGAGAGDQVDTRANHITTTTTTTKKNNSRVKSGEKATTDKAVAADDTGINKRDRAEGEPTADQQKNNKSDVQLTAEIRRAVVADKSLSINAHNIKIIVQDGRVTLKGPVGSKAEQVSVEKKAREIAGAAKVTSEIDIAP